jgi:hypothetical protein
MAGSMPVVIGVMGISTESDVVIFVEDVDLVDGVDVVTSSCDVVVVVVGTDAMCKHDDAANDVNLDEGRTRADTV